MTGLARSTFYYKSHPDLAQSARDATLCERMQALALVFPRYGYRRMTAQLRREGFQVNHKRVLRLMRVANLLCQTKRRFVRTTDSGHDLPLYPNLTTDLEPTQINQLWVSDITYIHVREGFAYLAVILDAFSRRVVGWALSRNIDSELTVAALRAAVQSRQPPAGCIHHSDRGVQYAATDYVELAKQHGLRLSMSGRANPYDNAKAESFFKTLKVEEIYLLDVVSVAELAERLPYYIDEIYNEQRLHSSLGYLPPVEFEALHLNSDPQAGDVLTTIQVCPV
jgi:transposase InsO family protein